MQQPIPPIFRICPLPPRPRIPIQVLLCRKPPLNSSLSDTTRSDPLRKRPAPIPSLLRRAKTPRPSTPLQIRILEPRLSGPHMHHPPGMRIPALGPRHPHLIRMVSGQPLARREPVQRRRLPTREEAAGLAHATHFAECGNGVGDVLQDLVRVHYVEGVGGEGQSVDVADHEGDIRYV